MEMPAELVLVFDKIDEALPIPFYPLTQRDEVKGWVLEAYTIGSRRD